MEEAIELANMGKGSLVSTIATADENIASEYVVGSAAFHGRILILNEESAPESTGHGSPMPLLSHGGPGRAGGELLQVDAGAVRAPRCPWRQRHPGKRHEDG